MLAAAWRERVFVIKVRVAVFPSLLRRMPRRKWAETWRERVVVPTFPDIQDLPVATKTRAMRLTATWRERVRRLKHAFAFLFHLFPSLLRRVPTRDSDLAREGWARRGESHNHVFPSLLRRVSRRGQRLGERGFLLPARRLTSIGCQDREGEESFLYSLSVFFFSFYLF